MLNAITVSVHPTKPTVGEPQRPRYVLRAGLHRLGLHQHVTQRLEPPEFLLLQDKGPLVSNAAGTTVKLRSFFTCSTTQ